MHDKSLAPSALVPWPALPLLIAASALVGVLISFGSLPVLILVGLAILAVAMVLLPLEFLMWGLIVLTFFVQGPVANFLKLPVAAWLSYAMAALVFLRALLDRLTQSPVSSSCTAAPPATNPTGLVVTPKLNRGDRTALQAGPGYIPVLLGLYLLIIVISTLVNRPPMAQLAVGVKTYLPFWAVTFALLFNSWRAEQLERIWRFLPWGLLLQVPLVAYQVLIVVPAGRAAGVNSAFDAVVGSFGGDGGNSSFLVVFAIAAALLAMARAQMQIGSILIALVTMMLAIGLTLAGEVKAAFVWVPIAIAAAFHDRIVKRPAVLLGALVGLAGFLIFLAAAYQALHWQSGTADHTSLEVRFSRATDYFFNPEELNYETGEVGRGASLMLWVNDRKTDWPNRLIGYGPAASKAKSLVAVGLLAKRFAPLAIGATTLAQLLWDAGVIGAALFLALILACLFQSLELSRDENLDRSHRAVARMLAGLFTVFLTMSVYGRTLTDEPCTQCLLALTIGYLVWLRRHRPGASAQALNLAR